MSTATDIDLELLVGEMEAVPCEHSTHQTDKWRHDDGPATHYVLAGCPSCDKTKDVFAACQGFIKTILAWPEFYCPRCNRTSPPSEFVTILGPVNK